MLIIAKREFRSYFDSPLAYVVICLSFLVLGAFFSSDKPREREAERVRRRDLVAAWLASDRDAVPHELA